MLLHYLHIDSFFAEIWEYLMYRASVTKCFFSLPQLGHVWEGDGYAQVCSRCPKSWRAMF